MKDFINLYLGELITAIIASLGGGFSGWFFTRQKYEAETKSVETDNIGKEIDNGNKIIEMYQKALSDLETRYEEKYKELKDSFDEKYLELKKRYDLQIILLQKDNEDCQKNYEVLKTAVDKNKKDLKKS